MRFQIVLLTIFAFAGGVFAQSGRTAADVSADPAETVSVRQMYEEADGYARSKFALEYQNKVPFSEKLQAQIFTEQKQLAARYASTAAARQDLTGEDFYYLGLLHWIAENSDGARENLRKFMPLENAAPVKLQISRSILTIIAARRKNFDEAEQMLAEYLKGAPSKTSDRVRMESELAADYRAVKNYPKAFAHTAEYLSAQRAVYADSKFLAPDPLFAALIDAFETYSDGGNITESDATLEEARKIAVAAKNPAFYFFALNARITYLIETGRKPLAFQTFQNASAQIKKDFTETPTQNYVLERLDRRGTQYRMLGEPAPELLDVQEFPGKSQKLADLRGKVVLIDFWATWCAPCLQSLPALTELHEDFAAQGLVILGLTRFYQAKENVPTEEAAEIQTLADFRRERKVPYDFIVSRVQDNQFNYGAIALPTTVLIDKKGIVRYLETGAGKTRDQEIRAEVEKLLAEK